MGAVVRVESQMRRAISAQMTARTARMVSRVRPGRLRRVDATVGSINHAVLVDSRALTAR